jgi:predicted pyridoxine 5'-phosphate oxidase superfamily flavin-nucleotide-binding protein
MAASHYMEIATTPAVRQAQAANGSLAYWDGVKRQKATDRLTEAEVTFIAARDSFYMASVSETGWPYVQHRGGARGFLRVLDERTLAFPDYRGNRQYISVGNLAANARVALFLMDYPNRRRLKIYATVEIKNLQENPALAEKIAVPSYPAKVERAFVLKIEAFDWNCPQHIVPRFTEAELGPALAPVVARIEHLEVENKALREKLVGLEARTRSAD